MLGIEFLQCPGLTEDGTLSQLFWPLNSEEIVRQLIFGSIPDKHDHFRILRNNNNSPGMKRKGDSALV